jgi:quaternary ammonium compound-resistance protein SugE
MRNLLRAGLANTGARRRYAASAAFFLSVDNWSMAWLQLLLAGLLEVCWAVGLKYTEGFTRPLPTALTIAAMTASIGLLGLAVRTLPIGTAYTVWTGIGAAGTVVAGILWLGEPASLLRLGCVLLIAGGILGLKLLTP